MAAADVGDPRAPLELCDDAVERGQPRVDEVGVVAGAEEPLAAVVDVLVVLVPADARAGAGGVGDLRRVQDGAERVLKQPRQIRRAVLVAERDRLLGRAGCTRPRSGWYVTKPPAACALSHSRT